MTRDTNAGPLLAAPDIDAVGPEDAAAKVPFEFCFDNHYDVLGVPRTAAGQEIARVVAELVRPLRRAAKQKDRAAQERSTVLMRAEETLSRPERRAAYDEDPEAVFFGIQDPFPEEEIGLAGAVQLIRAIVLGDGDLGSGYGDVRIEERPNHRLESCLRHLDREERHEQPRK